MKKEDLLKTLTSNPELLKELLQEAPELKTIIRQVIKTPRDKSLLGKLSKWGIKEIPDKYKEHIELIEEFLTWLDSEIQSKTQGKRGLHFSLRPIKKENQEQEEQEEQE